MEALEKAFFDYFSYLPQHISKWQMMVEATLPFMKALKNQLEQYCLIRSKKWNDENLIQKFPLIESRLLEKILQGIEQEVAEFRKLQCSLAALNRELFRKNDSIMKVSINETTTELTSKGSVVPPCWQLIELSENTKNYYAGLYLQLDIAFTCLKYEDMETVADLENTLLELSKPKCEIQDTVAITEFCRD